jgi:putative tryptophan/tyrosine transport system substrate-binding protein
MRRREFLGLVGSAAAWPVAARAQNSGKVFQIGILYPGPQTVMVSRIAAIQSGFLAGGLRVEQFEILPRAAEGNPAKLPPMAVDLIAHKVDVICALSPAAIRAARAASNTVPIVAGDLESDPVEAGFIATNARPGGNITGVFLDFPEFSKKWLEVLKETRPGLSTVAVLWDSATGPYQLNSIKAAAKSLGVTIALLEARRPDELEFSFETIAQSKAGALLMLSSPLIAANTKLLAGLALKYRLPAITLFSEFARDGGLMAYGPNLLGVIRQEGLMVAKVLLGANPATTPIETPTKFEFVLNLKTAHALGIAIPPSVLLRADEVIE